MDKTIQLKLQHFHPNNCSSYDSIGKTEGSGSELCPYCLISYLMDFIFCQKCLPNLINMYHVKNKGFVPIPNIYWGLKYVVTFLCQQFVNQFLTHSCVNCVCTCLLQAWCLSGCVHITNNIVQFQLFHSDGILSISWPVSNCKVTASEVARKLVRFCKSHVWHHHISETTLGTQTEKKVCPFSKCM